MLNEDIINRAINMAADEIDLKVDPEKLKIVKELRELKKTVK